MSRPAIVICPNGEPPEFHMEIFYGLFEGTKHADLWLRLTHLKGPEETAKCLNGNAPRRQHRIETIADY